MDDAFEVLHFVAAKRLAAARLTVVDATNVRREDRRPLLDLAREYHSMAVAIVLDLPESLCVERHRERPDRDFGRRVVAYQRNQLRRSRRGLKKEGFVKLPQRRDAVDGPYARKVSCLTWLADNM